MNSLTFKQVLGFGLVCSLVAVFVAILFSQNLAKASAPIGLQAYVATSSAPTVGTSPSLVFATSTCSARVITTYASPIMISLSDVQGFTPSATQGHLQAASTTVVYDSGLYGCGAVRIYSFVSGAITVTETR
jgi:hypothetical protein